jgi:hypothetical protein
VRLLRFLRDYIDGLRPLPPAKQPAISESPALWIAQSKARCEGWSDYMLNTLLCEFIDEQGLRAELSTFLSRDRG